jgi:hypothetical protein
MKTDNNLITLYAGINNICYDNKRKEYLISVCNEYNTFNRFRCKTY